MRDNKGITLIILIITVILLVIIAGVSVFEGLKGYNASKVARFETYMKMIQKKIDVFLEEGNDYTSIGSELTNEQKNILKNVIDQDGNIETTQSYVDQANNKLRYFSTADINTLFEIDDVSDDIVVNFQNREVISLNGVEKDGEMHFVEKGLH